MQVENNAGVVLFCVNDFFIVSVAQECQNHTVSAQRRLDNVWNIVFVGFLIEVFDWFAGMFAVTGQVVVGTVCNAPQLAPAEWEQEFKVGGCFGVEGKFFWFVVTQTQIFVGHARSSSHLWQKSFQYLNHSRSVSGLQKNSSSICSNSLVRKVKLPGVISLRKDLPTGRYRMAVFYRVVR